VRSLHWPGALLVLGFVGIVFETVTSLIPAPYANEVWVWETATTLGYGLAGFACWRWIVGNWNAQGQWTFVRGPSRWLAAASIVTAAGVAAITYNVHRFGGGGRWYPLHLAGYATGTLGFLLAAAGFWIASSARPAESGSEPASPDAPQSSTAHRISKSV
jgi:hypothetical protein